MVVVKGRSVLFNAFVTFNPQSKYAMVVHRPTFEFIVTFNPQSKYAVVVVKGRTVLFNALPHSIVTKSTVLVRHGGSEGSFFPFKQTHLLDESLIKLILRRVALILAGTEWEIKFNFSSPPSNKLP